MSRPIYTGIVLDRINGVIDTQEFDDEEKANQWCQSYHSYTSGPEEWDVKWKVVFGVQLDSGEYSYGRFGLSYLPDDIVAQMRKLLTDIEEVTMLQSVDSELQVKIYELLDKAREDKIIL